MAARSSAFQNLLINLVRRDLTVRYKSTVLGFLWSFLKPLALTGIFYVVFDRILSMPLEESRIPYALHLLVAMLAWTFFAGATTDAMNVILVNANLIKKVRLPLLVFPLATVCSHLIHFLLAQFVLIALLIACGLPPSPMFVLFLPLIALQCVIVLAVSLGLAALNVFYRDVSSIWEVLTTAWFYATPIIYPVYLATERLEALGMTWAAWLYLANPVTPIVLAYRRVLLYAAVDGDPRLEITDANLLLALGMCLGLSIALLGLGYVVFKRLSVRFADEL